MTIWQLMKNLRDKGWIPRWYNEITHTVYDKKHKIIWLYEEWKEFLILVYKKSLRDLCAKESWLWQFCVERGMVNGVDRWTLNARQKSIYDKYITSEKEYTPKMNYEYRIIESSLRDESELEQFLLDNIIIN